MSLEGEKDNSESQFSNSSQPAPLDLNLGTNTNEGPLQSQPPGSSRKTKSKRLFIGIVVALLTLTVGAMAYLWLSNKVDSDTDQSSNISSPKQLKEQSSESEKTIFHANKIAVSLEHPADWKVEVKDEIVGSGNDSYRDKSLVVESSAGNRLHLKDVTEGEFGGDCGPSVEARLIKRLDTKTPGVYFAEYSIVDVPDVSEGIKNEYYPDLPVFTAFGIHTYSESNELSEESRRFHVLNEGESATVSCGTARPYRHYSIHNPVSRARSSTVSIWIQASGTTGRSESRYNDIQDDTDFIAMLKSLEIVSE